MDKSQDLNAFINSDPENLDRFEQFLQEEGLKHQFEFVLAVRGLKSEPNHHLAQIIRTIYKHYFDVVHVSDSVRSKVKTRVTAREYSIEIFDDALEEVWDFLDTVVYKEFLNNLNQQSVNNTHFNVNVNASVNTTESCQNSTNSNNTNTNNTNNNNINSGNNSSNSSSLSVSASVVLASSESNNNINPNQNLSDQVSISSSSINTLGSNNTINNNTNNVTTSASSSKLNTIKQIPTCSILSSSSSSSSCSAAAVVSKLVNSSSLEPLIEGQELRQQQQLQSNPTCSSSLSSSSSNQNLVKNPIVGLTRETLLATQKQRCERDFTVDCMPLSLSKPKFPYHYANYNSFNPVSRVDSEVASFSSGCLTDSECGYGPRGNDDRGGKRARKKEELRVNCDNLPNLQQHIKSKEMRCPKKSEAGCQNMDTQTFANILIQKLQKLQKQREQEEKMKQNQKLSEEITQAIKEKLFVSSNEVQPDDILDNHVSRVWSDVTPDTGRSRDYSKSRTKCMGNPVLRSRIHNKEQEHQIPKSRTFPSTKYNDLDSGISITTTSTTSDDLVSNWIQNMNNTSSSGNNSGNSSSKPNSKSNPAKTNKKYMSEISCVVYYPETKHPYYYKMTNMSTNVSLNLFKEFLPKKPLQNYRYFFKYPTHDGVVREEIKNDEALVPMFDDFKIVAYLRDS